MKAANPERKLFQDGFQHRQQPRFPNLSRAFHYLPLGHLVYGINVVHPFGSVQVSLMHRVHTQVAGAGLADPLAGAPQLPPALDAFSHSSRASPDTVCAGAGCTSAPPRATPGAHIRPAQTRDTPAPECAWSPDRSAFRAPHPPSPAVRYPRACSVAETDDDDSRSPSPPRARGTASPAGPSAHNSDPSS